MGFKPHQLIAMLSERYVLGVDFKSHGVHDGLCWFSYVDDAVVQFSLMKIIKLSGKLGQR